MKSEIYLNEIQMHFKNDYQEGIKKQIMKTLDYCNRKEFKKSNSCKNEYCKNFFKKLLNRLKNITRNSKNN